MRLFLFCVWLAAFLPTALYIKGAHATEIDKTDVALFGAFVAATVVDWRQTQVGQMQRPQYIENNPWLGEHPTMRRINAYFAATLATTSIVAYVLPPPYRKLILGGMALREIHFDLANKRIGIGLSL